MSFELTNGASIRRCDHTAWHNQSGDRARAGGCECDDGVLRAGRCVMSVKRAASGVMGEVQLTVSYARMGTPAIHLLIKIEN